MTEEQIKYVANCIETNADTPAEQDALLCLFGSLLLYGLTVRQDQKDRRDG